MIYFEAHITERVLTFFMENENSLKDYLAINSNIKAKSGVNNFFDSQAEATELLTEIRLKDSIVSKTNRREYGDFQTNENLASRVAKYANKKNPNVEFILEPTCGKGNFLIACIKQFENLKKVVGVEIYKPYVWKTKFSILDYYLVNKTAKKPEIDIIHANAFEFDYSLLAISTINLKTLIIGNPPWVTNSELGSIDSTNLPFKSNYKKHKGLDAMTGKGNFDIGEYITNIMLKCFQNHNGLIAFLIKNSVVKNILYDQRINNFRLGNLEKLNIDSKMEFNVSVNASLFVCNLNTIPESICKEYNFYNKKSLTTFGWYKNKFVNSVVDYDKSSIVDGKSTFIWRSGVKHDCSKIMELVSVNGHYKNALGEDIHIENDLVYGLLKSSDLKDIKTQTYRKLTIITQRKVGQETNYIQEQFPLTYNYLNFHKVDFDNRKSSIYKDKPTFSIFGIGSYSFAPYKIAISGLYKSTHFTIVCPIDKKAVMLDDTCYFIGFEKLKMAKIAHYLLNSDLVQKFLKSIVFSDAKRSINKDILMRIDIKKAFEQAEFNKANIEIKDLLFEDWEEFGGLVKQGVLAQMMAF